MKYYLEESVITKYHTWRLIKNVDIPQTSLSIPVICVCGEGVSLMPHRESLPS